MTKKNKKIEPFLTLGQGDDAIQIFEHQLNTDSTSTNIVVNTRQLAENVGWLAGVNQRFHDDLSNTQGMSQGRYHEFIKEHESLIRMLFETLAPILTTAVNESQTDKQKKREEK